MLKNLVYFGSPEFSADILQSIIDSKLVNVVAVVTAPDKPQGRKQVLTPSPVAHKAEEHNLPCYKPAKLDDANLAHLRLLKPDIFLVVSYGKIIPSSWLTTPSIATFNIHFSLLPKYRGALCISEAIKNQDRETGVTLMVMDSALDHGDLVKQQIVKIEESDNVSDLTTKLTQAAKQILIQTLPEIISGTYTHTPQDESLATFTPSHKTVTRDSAYIPFADIQSATGNQARKIHALIRSLNPEPGAWTTINSQPLKIIRSNISGDKLQISELQLPGRQTISWKQFLSGHPL